MAIKPSFKLVHRSRAPELRRMADEPHDIRSPDRRCRRARFGPCRGSLREGARHRLQRLRWRRRAGQRRRLRTERRRPRLLRGGFLRADVEGARRRSTVRSTGSGATIADRSRSRATPTNAARASTISRLASVAPQRRAEYMVARGIPSSRVRTISYGKERPVATCNDISCWSQNRRAVTAIAPGDGNS